MRKELIAFLLHLRLPYNFFILSGVFLIGGFVATNRNFLQFFFQYINVHLFFYGGINVYNSFFDNDTGPIGGLKNPPPLKLWMLFASIFLQGISIVFAIPAGIPVVCLFVLGIIASILYSTPGLRWKSKPLLSLVIIGASGGIGAFFMGFFSMGGGHMYPITGLLLLGIFLILLAIYPLSQAYQVDEDKKRGDLTFSVRYGLAGIKKVFLLSYLVGIFFITLYLVQLQIILGMMFFGSAMIGGWYIWLKIQHLTLKPKSYELIMRLKYMIGMSVSGFTLLLIALRQLGTSF